MRAVGESTRQHAWTPGKVDGLQTSEEVSVFLEPTEKSACKAGASSGNETS